MVYLIGVDHLVQYSGPVPESIRIEFLDFIVDACRMHGIQAIAEEFSEEALREVYHAERETAGEAAAILKIKHRYCDPEEKQLAELGIPYYADVFQHVKNKYSISGSFILDDTLREKVKRETADIVRSYWPIREKYWYTCIADLTAQPILFICGHEHVSRFQTLLTGKAHECTIIDPFWRNDLFSDYRSLDLV